jgi:hypothetical protein
MPTYISSPEVGRRLHIENEACPVCGDRPAYIKAWREHDGFVLAHGSQKHLVAKWPWNTAGS